MFRRMLTLTVVLFGLGGAVQAQPQEKLTREEFKLLRKDIDSIQRQLDDVKSRVDKLEGCPCPDKCKEAGDCRCEPCECKDCKCGAKRTCGNESPKKSDPEWPKKVWTYAEASALAKVNGKPVLTFVGCYPVFPDGLGSEEVLYARVNELEGFNTSDLVLSRFEHGEHIYLTSWSPRVNGKWVGYGTADDVHKALAKPVHSAEAILRAIGGSAPVGGCSGGSCSPGYQFVPASGFYGGGCSGGSCSPAAGSYRGGCSNGSCSGGSCR